MQKMRHFFGQGRELQGDCTVAIIGDSGTEGTVSVFLSWYMVRLAQLLLAGSEECFNTITPCYFPPYCTFGSRVLPDIAHQ